MPVGSYCHSPGLLWRRWRAIGSKEHQVFEQRRAVDDVPDRTREPLTADDLLGLEEGQYVLDELGCFKHFQFRLRGLGRFGLWKRHFMIVQIDIRKSFV